MLFSEFFNFFFFFPLKEVSEESPIGGAFLQGSECARACGQGTSWLKSQGARICARLRLCKIMHLRLLCAPMHAPTPGCSTESGHHRPLFKRVFNRCSKKIWKLWISFFFLISLGAQNQGTYLMIQVFCFKANKCIPTRKDW